MNYRAYKGPRYWPTWILLAALWLIGNLPLAVQLFLGRRIGALVYRWPNNRTEVARINLQLCFPALSDTERERLLRLTLIENAVGMVMTTRVWFGDVNRLRGKALFTGMENIDAALAKNNGVIMLGLHFATLELAGSLFANLKGYQYSVLYRKFKNEFFDAVIKERRGQYYQYVIERSQTIRVYKLLKSGGILWYAPDHDYGQDQSVFAPFFDISAATITATMRLSNINQSPVIISDYHWREDGLFSMSAGPILADFPSGDDVADATRLNALFEQAVRKHPAQYIWTHRRFKTRPPGETSPYKGLNIRNKIGRRINKKRYDFLTSWQYNQLLTGSEQQPSVLLAESGEIYKIFRSQSLLSKFRCSSAWRFYRNGQKLAQLQISCPQPTAMSRYPERRTIIAVYPGLPGVTIRQRLSDTGDQQVLALLPAFLADLHSKGVIVDNLDLSHILLAADDSLALLSVADTRFTDKPLTVSARRQNLQRLLENPIDQAAFQAYGIERFINAYCTAAAIAKTESHKFLPEHVG